MGPLTVLNDEEAMLQASVRRFAREQIAPRVRAMDESAALDPTVLRELFALGLMGIEIPEASGGAAGTFFQSVLCVEEIAAVDPAVAVIVDVQNTLVINALLRYGSDAQHAAWLPLLNESLVGAYALSEAGSGSDAFALATTARPDGDSYLLNGRKLWISSAHEAGLFLVFATLNPADGYRGITCFLVPRQSDGLHIGKKEDKLGIRASSTAEVALNNVRVPRSAMLGQPGKGYKIAIETLNEGRIAIGGQLVGLARGAYQHALAYAKQRRQFGKPIAEFQGVQFQLAEMATKLEGARLMVYNAARLREAGKSFVTEAAMAKLYASTVAEEIASQAVEIFGGIGFTKDSPVEKYYRDVKIGRIYEGTSNLQRITIAKGILS
ncbi:MAG: acyl-CoA dehydrogenase family protein [Acidobacteriota bacterium]|jgi:alkylation response protein AidB-like acyl-CoA dehydrogenase|nr:acyl-CoA dehydrogenase family protein [Bryobacteraceae bacterium CoA2 C42]MCA2963399.1 acyl-CoA dehydrogenase family protein [Acidobacteriaceae bacterium]